MDIEGFKKAQVLVAELDSLRNNYAQISKHGLPQLSLPGALYNSAEAKQAAVNGVLRYIKDRFDHIKNDLWVYHSITMHRPEDKLGYEPEPEPVIIPSVEEVIEAAKRGPFANGELIAEDATVISHSDNVTVISSTFNGEVASVSTTQSAIEHKGTGGPQSNAADLF